MDDTSFKTVDEYIAGQPEATRAELKHVRNTMKILASMSLDQFAAFH
jgi:hypothetical protein